MRYILDKDALQEDLRKLGIALMAAAVVGTFFTGVPLRTGVIGAILGAILVLAGLVRRL